jgi:tetratricopeptide (TPR) repeat protein
MPGPSAISSRTRHLLVVTTAVFLVVVDCACHRSSGKNSKGADTAASSTNESDIEQAKREAQSLVDKGKELYKDDRDEQAIEAFQQAIRLQPDLAEAHLRLGMAYAALEKKNEAEDSYKKAIELYKKIVQSNPKDAEGFFNLGEAYSFLHQDEEAARAFRQASHLQPNDEEAYYQLGMSETKLAHYPEATAAFQKALDLDPNDYRATDAINNAREGAKRIQEGKKHAEEMLKKQQANQNANGNLNANAGSGRRPVPTRSPPRPW